MKENMNVTYTRMFDLANATYNTWLNAIIWGTERALELNKTIIAQYEANQIEARKYAQDLAEKGSPGCICWLRKAGARVLSHTPATSAAYAMPAKPASTM